MVAISTPPGMAGLNVLALCFKLSNCYGTNCATMPPLTVHPCQITALPSQKIMTCVVAKCQMRALHQGRNWLIKWQISASVWGSQCVRACNCWRMKEVDGWEGGWRDHNWIWEHFLLFNHSLRKKQILDRNQSWQGWNHGKFCSSVIIVNWCAPLQGCAPRPAKSRSCPAPQTSYLSRLVRPAVA